MSQHIQLLQRLTRSPHGAIAGVCAGLSDYFGINLLFIRLVFIVLGLANGIGLVLYIILLIAVPASPPAESSIGTLTRPQRSKKGFLTYIVGTVSVCATLSGVIFNVFAIFEAVEWLCVWVLGPR